MAVCNTTVKQGLQEGGIVVLALREIQNSKKNFRKVAFRGGITYKWGRKKYNNN